MDLDGPHPAENRKVGGSIPSLPTRSAQLRGLCAGTSPLDEPPGCGIVEASLPNIGSWSRLDSILASGVRGRQHRRDRG